MTDVATMRIGYIGLGAMGLPMASHLASRYGEIAAFDVAPSPQARATAGLSLSASARAVAEASDAILLCLPSESASIAAIEGDDGVLGGARPGLIVVDCSTLDPVLARRFAAKLAAREVAYFDAPVFGTPQNARDGVLTVAMSGPERHWPTARDIVAPFARRALYAGASGAASLIKVVQNGLGLVQIAAIAEAFSLVEAAGGDPLVFRDIVVGSGGMADSALFAKIGGDLAAHEARFGALLRIAVKDIGLGRDLAARLGVDAALLARAADFYDVAARDGSGEDDLLGVAATIRRSVARSSAAELAP